MNQLKVDPTLFEELSKLKRSMLDENGRETPNPRPKDVAIGLRPPSLQEQIQRLIKVELSEQMQKQGAETFEEANDFEVDDEEGDPLSPYALEDMEPDAPDNLPPSPNHMAVESSHDGPATEETDTPVETAEKLEKQE